MPLVVATFYKFVRLADVATKQQPLQSYCQTQNIKGTILLAEEGINGTIAGTRQGIDAVLAWLRSDSRLADLEHRETYVNSPPFGKLKIKLKSEIVTFGVPEVDPDRQVGNYVDPKDWNKLISDPEVLTIDTRNQYEVEMGSFKGAKNPQTDSFREFPDYVVNHLDPQKHPKIAMFCTGGIRCEKATSFLLSKGFKQVYHLKGGILKYLEEVPPEESLWEGECFVFDERVAVKHGLAEGSYEICYGCGHPVSPADQASPQYEAGIVCPHCFGQLTPEKKARQQERQRQRQQNKQAFGKGQRE